MRPGAPRHVASGLQQNTFLSNACRADTLTILLPGVVMLRWQHHASAEKLEKQGHEMRGASMFDLVVVGGGPAGVTAALRAAELGASVALVERGNLGGTCTNDGCVPTRVLAKAARLMRDAEQYAEYGLRGAKPELDFAALLAHAQQTVYRVHEKKQLRAHLEE